MTNQERLEAWYRHAAGSAGFIGEALRAQRKRAFLLQEQQRAIIGLQGEQYNVLWLHQQAIPLPRRDHFAAHLARIAAKVQADLGKKVDLHLEHFEELIRAGL